MSKRQRVAATEFYLGIDAGATRTIALAVDLQNRVVSRHEAGAANLRLSTDEQLRALFDLLAQQFARPKAIAIGMAGARTARDKQRIAECAGQVWPATPCRVTDDLETALAAAETDARLPEAAARVLVLSGTGSCCFGRAPDGKTAKIGGWGHLLGDKGSGYEMGLRGLKTAVYYFDRDGVWPLLGQRILRALQLNQPDDLISWAAKASKAQIASLAVEVFEAWSKGDHVASDILEAAAHSLAQDAANCAKKLAPAGAPVEFIFSGGVLLRQPKFAELVRSSLRERWSQLAVTKVRREPVWGAIILARKQAGEQPAIVRHHEQSPSLAEAELRQSPTEARNPVSAGLDRLPLAKAIQLMLREERKVPRAILVQVKKIERCIAAISRALKQGGRLLYIGAGTSGRLGVLDAAECPPTFGTPPESVQGIIAGGQTALWQAVEGAEDDPQAGAEAIRIRGVGAKDIVIGITASGRAPFVWGGLKEAKALGAQTALLTFNPRLKIARGSKPHLVIAPDLGPEILTGSTRLKAGTATKIILNMLTTLSMVRLGRVQGNLMVALKPTNSKLRDRAVRIVQEITGAEYSAALAALERSGWQVKVACRDLDADQ